MGSCALFLHWQVGVDNMCILVHALKRQDLNLNLETRVGLALAEVGPSITLASVAEVLAFTVGISTPMPACRVFSLFAGTSSYRSFCCNDFCSTNLCAAV